jgi:hypothetical protein
MLWRKGAFGVSKNPDEKLARHLGLIVLLKNPFSNVVQRALS